jgi:tRNA wybutosine-synthesizing protein 2
VRPERRRRGPRVAPTEAVRARLRSEYGEPLARQLPVGYQRLGSVLLLRLPERLRPAFPLIGEAYREVLGVSTVLRSAGAVRGEFREPAVERIAGTDSETTVVEHGIRFRFDAARILFARGNREERHRFGRLVRPGETVVDLFAGIGYFTLPALLTGRAACVHAVEKNPVSFGYLVENLRRNGVAERAFVYRSDNREAGIPPACADRVVLGYLPTALPWVGEALGLLRPSGGSLHVHLLVGSHEGPSAAVAKVRAAVDSAGGRIPSIAAREVKPYGPGRSHVVVDVGAVPGDGRA